MSFDVLPNGFSTSSIILHGPAEDKSATKFFLHLRRVSFVNASTMDGV